MAKQLVRRSQSSGSNENVKQIQKFINDQIYIKGFNQNVVIGSNEIDTLQLGGKARFMYGINLFVNEAGATDDDTISMVLNEETILDKVNWKSFYPMRNPNKMQQYYPLPRPLFGSDSLSITWNAASAKTVYFTFYLSDVDQRTAQ